MGGKCAKERQKAAVLEETRKMIVREVKDPEIKQTTGVLIRATSSAICGTDLHFYEGRMRGIEGGMIGHEPLGVVVEAGSAVKGVQKGDRVTVPTHICCGFCAMCVDGHSSACLTTNPDAAGAPKDPSGPEPTLGQGKLLLPWDKLFGKNVRITMGRDDDERWNGKLRDMILTGVAKPSRVVSHRLSLDEAPEAFRKFDAREEGYLEVVLKP